MRREEALCFYDLRSNTDNCRDTMLPDATQRSIKEMREYAGPNVRESSVIEQTKVF